MPNLSGKKGEFVKKRILQDIIYHNLVEDVCVKKEKHFVTYSATKSKTKKAASKFSYLGMIP